MQRQHAGAYERSGSTACHGPSRRIGGPSARPLLPSHVALSGLRSLEPVTGSASRFTETLAPEESNERSLLIVNASGTLDDGRSFSLRIFYYDSGRIRRVLVTFGR